MFDPDSHQRKRRLFPIVLLLGLTIAAVARAQTTSFTYQGRLTDGGIPANGNYDLQFALWDSATNGNQIGSTQTISNVPVGGSIFTVTLDFGANAFSGPARFLEISTRVSGGGSFTLLSPRQPITSTPYAVRSLNAGAADVATSAAQLNGVAAANFVQTNDSRLTDARAPTAGSTNYIQNTGTPRRSLSTGSMPMPAIRFHNQNVISWSRIYREAQSHVRRCCEQWLKTRTYSWQSSIAHLY